MIGFQQVDFFKRGLCFSDSFRRPDFLSYVVPDHADGLAQTHSFMGTMNAKDT